MKARVEHMEGDMEQEFLAKKHALLERTPGCVNKLLVSRRVARDLKEAKRQVRFEGMLMTMPKSVQFRVRHHSTILDTMSGRLCGLNLPLLSPVYR
eukprot:CAMPEP_0118989570 /NCGR_PEP_ID=MMETSP1173-20130426/48253_1 /TAXON_ID=1034831 /ORGANISM="Rhizochromulina marina cf, Strain CCMP1243" /LENGTH=95 /DNA_ID=CAMNT_0006940569 /DNA_START=45 /DNA_END=328 /DNA_ORIENTATION=-